MYFAGLVLRDFVVGVLFAVLALAIGAASLWYVDLGSRRALAGLFSCTYLHLQSTSPVIRPTYLVY